MSLHRGSLLCLFLTLAMPFTLHAQQIARRVIAVEDKTEVGTPLQVSGYVSFDESVASNQVASSRSEDLRIRNVSDKAILLLIATLQEAGSRSSQQDVELVVDKFFEQKAILPGEEVVLLQRPHRDEYIVEPFRAAPKEEKPARAEFWLRFVQFSDGSTFGNPMTASKWLEKRESHVTQLRTLREIYQQRGEAAFVEALEQYSKDRGLGSVPKQAWQVQQASGSEAALNLIDRALVMASKHAAELAVNHP